MIIDYTCSRCGDDHALPVDQYPNVGRAPRPVKRGPTPEQQHTWAMREIEYRITAENRERCKEEERLERKKALEHAKVQEMFKTVHREQEAARAAKSAQIKAEMAEVRAFIEAQKQGRRLDQRFGHQASRPITEAKTARELSAVAFKDVEQAEVEDKTVAGLSDRRSR